MSEANCRTNGPTLVVAVFLFSFLLAQHKAWAELTFDAASGEDQSFTTGYAGRYFSETFHQTEVAGTVLPAYGPDAWKFKKSFNFSTLYDTNLNSELHDPKDDIIYSYKLPISATRQGPKGYVALFYNVAYTQFIETEKSSHINHSFGHATSFKMGKLTVNFTDSFTPSKAVAVGERTELRTAESSRVTTLSNSATMDVKFEMTPKTTLSASYSNSIFYFPVKENSVGTSSFSTQTHTYGPTLAYKITPKTEVHTRYTWSIVDYFVGVGDLDSMTETASVGTSGKLTPKMGYSLDLGLLNREYKHLDVEDTEGYTVSAAFSRKFTEKITGSLSANRDTTVENLDPDKSESLSVQTDFYSTRLTWLVSPRVNLNFNASAGTIERDGFITQGDPDNPTLTFTRPNNDDFYQMDVLLNWAPRRYVSMTLGYSFFNKNSTFKNNEFDTKRFLGTVNCQF